MQSFYREVLEALDGEGGALLSIVEASGSAPRGVGARMLVRADGSAVGTIGGGAVEHAAQQLAEEVIARRTSLLKEYRLSPNQVSDLGMVCGGNITVYIHYLRRGDADSRALYAQVADCCGHNEPCTVVTAMRDGACTLYLDAEDSPCPPPLKLRGELDKHLLTVVESDGTRYAIEPIVQGGRVLVFGAGHVGRELSWLLHHMGFYHIVLDDRAVFLTEENLPVADQRERREFLAAVSALEVTARDYIVIMTRGHLHDLTVVRDALGTPARYIGMIGSRGKVAATFQTLRDEGFTETDISRVKAPIGIPLGGKTPEEVALSVVAELVRARNGYAGKRKE